VEVAAALVEEQLEVGGGLEPSAEAALGLADALRHGPDLAVAASEDADDPVGLTELVGSQHDPLVSVQAHEREAIRRRRRSGAPSAGTLGPRRRGARAGSPARASR